MSETPTVDPQTLLAALEAAGFTEYSRGNGGAYVRMNWPKDVQPGQPSVLVPLLADAPEYDRMVGALLATLALACAPSSAPVATTPSPAMGATASSDRKR